MIKRINTSIILALVVSFSIILGVLASYIFQASVAFGSVTQGNEYRATSTVPIIGGTTLASTLQRQIKTNYDSSSNTQVGSTVLGSIVIASTSPSTTGQVKIWNATSTTDVSSSTVVYMASNTAAGTYTYDMSLSRGMIIELPAGFNGSYNITSR